MFPMQRPFPAYAAAQHRDSHSSRSAQSVQDTTDSRPSRAKSGSTSRQGDSQGDSSSNPSLSSVLSRMSIEPESLEKDLRQQRLALSQPGTRPAGRSGGSTGEVGPPKCLLRPCIAKPSPDMQRSCKMVSENCLV